MSDPRRDVRAEEAATCHYAEALRRQASPAALADIAAGLDPGLIQILDLVHAAQTVTPGPDALFVARLEHQLLQGKKAGLQASAISNVSRSSPATKARVPSWAPRAGLPHEALSRFATGVLCLVVLVSSILVLASAGTWGLGREHSGTLVIGAPQDPTAPAGVVTTPLLDLVLPTIDASQVWVQLDRYSLPPGTTLHLDMRGGSAPAIAFVAAGDAAMEAVAAPNPARVIHAGGGSADELRETETATLTGGDTVMVPANGAVELRNDAAAPAVVFTLVQPIDVSHPSSPSLEYRSLTGRIRNVRAPLTISLRQVTLDPGAFYPNWNLSLPPTGATSPPDTVHVAAIRDPDRAADGIIDEGGALRNRGDTPLVAYILTVTSAGTGS